MTGEFLGFLVGLAIGVVVTAALLLARLRREREAARQLGLRLDEAGAAQVALSELRAHLSGLRHDMRGILSPALLVADGLVDHAEPKVRRAGDVMVRTVDRAIVRLSETRLGDPPTDATRPP